MNPKGRDIEKRHITILVLEKKDKIKKILFNNRR